MAQLDINPILRQTATKVNSAVNEISAYAEQAKVGAAKAATLADKMVGAVKKQGEAKASIVKQLSVEDLKLQNQKQEIFDAGGGMNAAVYLRKQLVTEMADVEKAAQQQEQIAAQETSGVVDYFKQQFALIGANRNVYDQQQDVNRVRSNIAAWSESQESLSRAVNTTKKTVTEGTIAETEKQIAAETIISAGEYEYKGLASNAQALARLTAASQAQISAAESQLRSTQRAEELKATIRQIDFREKMQPITLAAAELNLKQNEEAYSMALKTNPARADEFLAKVEESRQRREEAKIRETNRATYVTKGQAIAGFEVPWDQGTITFKAEHGSAQDKLLVSVLEKIGATDSFGQTPAEAIKTVEFLGARSSPATDLLRGLALEFSNGAGKGLKADEWEANFNAYVESKAADWNKEIKDGDPNNPLSIKAFGEIEDFRAVQETKTYKKVWKPMEMKEFSPKRLAEAALDGVDAGDITLEDAAQDLVSVFKAGKAYVNAKTMFDRIATPPMQDAYNVRLVDAPVFSAKTLAASGAGALAIGASAASGVGIIPAGLTVAGSMFLGSYADKLSILPKDFGVTNGLSYPQVRDALIKLKAERDGTFDFFSK